MSVFAMLRAARPLWAQPASYPSLAESAAQNADTSEPTQVGAGSEACKCSVCFARQLRRRVRFACRS